MIQFIKACETLICIRHGEVIAKVAVEEDRKMAVRLHAYTYSDVAATAAAPAGLIRIEDLQVEPGSLGLSVCPCLGLRKLFCAPPCFAVAVSSQLHVRFLFWLQNDLARLWQQSEAAVTAAQPRPPPTLVIAASRSHLQHRKLTASERHELASLKE